VTWKEYSLAPSRSRAACPMIAVLVAATSAARAQAPASGAPVIGSSPRRPSIQLVQPVAGANIPTDRPTVSYRYVPGEATDPIDDSSFQLWIDGVERTQGFRVGNGEAWGTLGAARPLSPGAHLVIARVCSVRGICAAANDVIVAVPTAAALPDDATGRTTQPRKHNHLKQPQTLLGDLVSNVIKLFRH
jgi:hypothetical protein